MKTYSPMETKILAAIPEDGTRVSTLDLVEVVYDEAPLSARQSVLDAACKLIRKVDANEERFEIVRSEARGATPIYFWRLPRKKFIDADLFTKESA